MDRTTTAPVFAIAAALVLLLAALQLSGNLRPLRAAEPFDRYSSAYSIPIGAPASTWNTLNPDGVGTMCAGPTPPDPEYCRTDCVVSDWAPCSTNCGRGTQARTVLQPATNGGAACPELSRPCHASTCTPVDCRVSDWTTCSATHCGQKGQQTRAVLKHAANGGRACPELTQACSAPVCSAALTDAQASVLAREQQQSFYHFLVMHSTNFSKSWSSGNPPMAWYEVLVSAALGATADQAGTYLTNHFLSGRLAGPSCPPGFGYGGYWSKEPTKGKASYKYPVYAIIDASGNAKPGPAGPASGPLFKSP